MTSNYWQSSQCNHWLLSRRQVAIARSEDLQYAQSAEELAALRIWFTNCICQLTKRLSLRQRITATAIVFFHRFYSCSPANSFSSTDPALVATACVYVASKVEETPIHIRNIVSEATKFWNSLGYFAFPAEVTDVAEMEFYLLEDLQFHLIVHHPYKSLVSIASSAGKGRNSSTTDESGAAAAKAGGIGLGLSTPLPISLDSSWFGLASNDATSNLFDTDLAYGAPASSGSTMAASSHEANPNGTIDKAEEKMAQVRALERSIEEKNRMMLYQGDDGMPVARLEELDEQALQMAWFLLNDTYRTDVILLYPPHLIAIASIFLALVLHESSRNKMLISKRWMDSRRAKYEAMLSGHQSTSKEESGSSATPTASSSSMLDSTPANSTGMGSNTPRNARASAPQQRSGNGTGAPGGTTTPSASTTAVSPASATTPYDTPKPMLDASPGAPSPASQPSPANAANLPTGSSPEKTPHQLGRFSQSRSIPQAGQAAAPPPPPPLREQAPLPLPPAPPPDAMTFLAALNIDLGLVGEVVQEILSLYALWNRIGGSDQSSSSSSSGATGSARRDTEEDELGRIDLGDGSVMLKRLNRMRERRFQDLKGSQ